MEWRTLGASGERTEVILLISHSFDELPPAVDSVLQCALGSLFVFIILRADPLSVVGRRGVRGEEFPVPGRLDIRHPACLPAGLHVNPHLLLQVLQSRRETGGQICGVTMLCSMVVTCLDVSGADLLLLPGSSGPLAIPAKEGNITAWLWLVLCINIILFCFKIFP